MYQTSREKKLSEEWVQWLLQCAMTRFPESIQITVHVLQSQQQVGPLKHIAQLQWKPPPPPILPLPARKTGSKHSDGRRALFCSVLNRHEQTWTLSLPPSWGFKRSQCRGDVLTKRSQWREGMHMTWLSRCGPTWGRGGLHQISHAVPVTKADEVACPKWAPTLPQTFFVRPRPTNQGSLWENFVWLDDRRWSGSSMTQIWSWLSLITLALYIHPIWMNSALHKKYKGKILVLHYTFSKIYTE